MTGKMLTPRVAVARLIDWFRRARLDQDTADELQFHFEMLARDLESTGLTPGEARRQAHLRFGGLEQTQERVRVARATWLDGVWQDIRFARRSFARSPGFTVVAVLTIALGVSLSAAIFSVVDGVLFRPLPFREPGRLVTVEGAIRSQNQFALAVSANDLEALRAGSRSCNQIAASEGVQMWHLASGDMFEEWVGIKVSQNFLATLGVTTRVGRDFVADEFMAGAPPAALISDGLWTRRFARDPGIVGKRIGLAFGLSLRVVGVLPRDFHFPVASFRGPSPDIITPLLPPKDEATRRGRRLHLLARLKPGVTPEAAEADVSGVITRGGPKPVNQPSRRDAFDGVAVRLLHARMAASSRPTMLALQAGMTLVLLIVCVNIANLLLARGTARSQELTVRASLGASRARLVRQMMTESLLLASAGGILGVVLAFFGVGLLRTQIPPYLQLMKPVEVDLRLLTYSLGVTGAIGILFGAAPAMRLSRGPGGEPRTSLRPAGGGRGDWGQGLLIFSQVSMALVVAMAGTLLVGSFLKLKLLDLGFSERRALTLSVFYPYPDHRQFFSRVPEALRSLPGVQSAAAASGWFMEGALGGSSYSLNGRREHEFFAGDEIAVTPGYFSTLGIPLVAGRGMTEADGAADRPVAIIAESLARRLPEGVNPLGQRIVDVHDPSDSREIVGVVRDIRAVAVDEAPIPMLYLPLSRDHSDEMMRVVVRTSGDPNRISTSVIARIKQLDRRAVVHSVRTVDELVNQSLSTRRFRALLFGTFSLASLALCAVGVYGVLAYGVARRTREFGVRMALGAARGQVLRAAAAPIVRPVVLGLTAGAGGAVAIARLLRTLTVEIQVSNPSYLLFTMALLLGVALVAAILPARRATAVDPARALRSD